MLGSIITARDRWLKPGGLILPSDATVSISLVCIVGYIFCGDSISILIPFIWISLKFARN